MNLPDKLPMAAGKHFTEMLLYIHGLDHRLMLIFAHLGLTLAAASLFRRMNPVMILIAFGSLLPDIIDKPLGYFIFGTASMGRIYAHTLLFLLVLMALSAIRWNIVSLSGGVFAHLFLDQMWSSPAILLWPLLGGFPVHDNIGVIGYLESMLMELTHPSVLIPELMGLMFVVYLALRTAPSIISRSELLSDLCFSATGNRNH